MRQNPKRLDFSQISVSEQWNFPTQKEELIHRIHSYPAKFPAFITSKAIEYARAKGTKLNTIGDIFCGCGTTAYEAKKAGINFWGCDINPVATLIAEVKSQTYSIKKLQQTKNKILELYDMIYKDSLDLEAVNPRIKYWYDDERIKDLSLLKEAINIVKNRNGRYKKFFLVAFSNILKPTSRWLTKSIKPTIDPNKKSANVREAYVKQVDFMIKAFAQAPKTDTKPEIQIETTNVSSLSNTDIQLDLIVTSPPYVTSYEYADLHQLSTLWLDYTEDYRSFREGTIGSVHNHVEFEKDVESLNRTGEKIVFQLYDKDKARAKNAARYYRDMQNVTGLAYQKLTKKGYAFFVIGDTEYKGVLIENAKHLEEAMYRSGFRYLKVHKRKISNKILTPYRDANGKFTSSSKGRKVYAEEYIVIGKKMKG